MLVPQSSQIVTEIANKVPYLLLIVLYTFTCCPAMTLQHNQKVTSHMTCMYLPWEWLSSSSEVWSWNKTRVMPLHISLEEIKKTQSWAMIFIPLTWRFICVTRNKTRHAKALQRISYQRYFETHLHGSTLGYFPVKQRLNNQVQVSK